MDRRETGRAAHFDGTSWTTQRVTGAYELFGVWDARPNDVWIVGMNYYDPSCSFVTICSFLWHWDGTGFTAVLKQPDRLFHGIWGSSSKDIWIVGNDATSVGLAWHYDGSTLTEMTLPMGNYPYSVSGTAADDVWMVASLLSPPGPGAVFHYDGTSLKNVPVPVSLGGDLYAVQARSRSDVWVGGDALYHFDGTNWSAYRLPNSQSVFALWASSPTDVWASGVRARRYYSGGDVDYDSSDMQHFDGATFFTTSGPRGL